MTEQVAILPMAVAMVAGPQIITAVFLATSRQPRLNSLAYIGGVAIAVLAGLAISFVTARLFNEAAEATGASTADDWLTWVIVALLGALSIRTFLGRKSATTPKWMASLQDAEPKAAFKLGLVLFLLMPSDIAVLLAVGAYLAQNKLGYVDGVPFVALTVLLVALPFLGYLVLGQRGEVVIPRMRDWMNRYSWAISIGVYIFFIYAFVS